MSEASGAGGWSESQRRHEHQLLDEFRRLALDDPRRVQVRDELITMHLPLVRHLAARYRDRGEPWDDLMQVGTVGLIKAIDGYDSDRGVELATYATPTILGEIKRHFRDRTWAVRVPRRLQELQARATARTDELSISLGRSPTVRELADSLDVTEAEVLEALEARHAYAAESIEADDEEASSPSVASSWGDIDPGFALVDDREVLEPLLLALPERERSILMMRFFRNMSQSEIGAELGLSQMHVSRLLARTLAQLRAELQPA